MNCNTTHYRANSSSVPGDPTLLRLTKPGGDIHLDRAPGGAIVSTGGGAIVIGAATGLVKASTGGGDVSIGPVAGSVFAGTGAGDVEVTLEDAGGAEQRVEVRSGNGGVTITLPSGFDGRLELETSYTESFGRATRIDAPASMIRSRETSRDWESGEGTPRKYVRATGQAGKGRGLVKVKTVNGDVEVRLAL